MCCLHFHVAGESANDCARYLFPIDPNPNYRWIGQGVRTAAALYYKLSALHDMPRWSCSPGGLWDFYGRSREDIRDSLILWASDRRMQDDAGMCMTFAVITGSADQWNAYSSLLGEKLQGFQPGEAARHVCCPSGCSGALAAPPGPNSSAFCTWHPS